MIAERAEMYLFFLLAPLMPAANCCEMIMRSEKIVVSKTFFFWPEARECARYYQHHFPRKDFFFVFFQSTQIYILSKHHIPVLHQVPLRNQSWVWIKNKASFSFCQYVLIRLACQKRSGLNDTFADWSNCHARWWLSLIHDESDVLDCSILLMSLCGDKPPWLFFLFIKHINYQQANRK